jgi:hypothetical protein
MKDISEYSTYTQLIWRTFGGYLPPNTPIYTVMLPAPEPFRKGQKWPGELDHPLGDTALGPRPRRSIHYAQKTEAKPFAGL